MPVSTSVGAQPSDGWGWVDGLCMDNGTVNYPMRVSYKVCVWLAFFCFFPTERLIKEQLLLNSPAGIKREQVESVKRKHLNLRNRNPEHRKHCFVNHLEGGVDTP